MNAGLYRANAGRFGLLDAPGNADNEADWQMLNATDKNAWFVANSSWWRRLFFPCAAPGSSLEPGPEAVKRPSAGNPVCVSSAGSSFALSRKLPRQDGRLCVAMKSTHRGATGDGPNRSDNLRPTHNECRKSLAEFAPEFFEGKLRRKNLQPNSSNERTLTAPTQ